MVGPTFISPLQGWGFFDHRTQGVALGYLIWPRWGQHGQFAKPVRTVKIGHSQFACSRARRWDWARLSSHSTGVLIRTQVWKVCAEASAFFSNDRQCSPALVEPSTVDGFRAVEAEARRAVTLNEVRQQRVHANEVRTVAGARNAWR